MSELLSLASKLFKAWTLMPFVFTVTGTIIFLVMFTLFVKYIIKPYILLKKYEKVPGARTLFIPLLGILWKFKRNAKTRGDYHYLSKKTIQEDPDMRFIASPYKDKVMVLLYDPVLVKVFLAKEAGFTTKDSAKFQIFHKSAQKGLTFASGSNWTSQRKAVSDVFNPDFVNDFIPTIQSTAKEWIGHNFKENSNAVDIVNKVNWFTAKIGAKLFFGEHAFSTSDEFKEFMETGTTNHATWTKISSSPWRFFLGSKFYRLGLRSIDRLYNGQVKFLNQWYDTMIEKFKKSLQEKQTILDSTSQKTLLELFLSQENPKLSDADIVGQVSTFFAAETNSTAAFLTSALYFIAYFHDAQQKLRSEIQERYESSTSVDFESLSRMEYLDAVLKETFRLQTPTSLLQQRIVNENMTLMDVDLKKGYRVNVDVLGMGYNPKMFDSPAEFKPERWIEKKDAGVTEKFAHIPFSEGAHQCPGQQFALIQSKILLCELLKKFELKFKEGFKLRLDYDFVYRISEPLELILTKV